MVGTFGRPRMTDGLPLLYAVPISAVLLGIPAAALYWLGQRYGRRLSFKMGAIVVRAGLGSLILSWSFFLAAGHGVVPVVLPAWLPQSGLMISNW